MLSFSTSWTIQAKDRVITINHPCNARPPSPAVTLPLDEIVCTTVQMLGSESATFRHSSRLVAAVHVIPHVEVTQEDRNSRSGFLTRWIHHGGVASNRRISSGGLFTMVNRDWKGEGE